MSISKLVPVFTIFSFFFLISCGDQRSEAERLEAARRFIAADDYNAAIVELKSILQINASNAEARWVLGEAQLEVGDASSASKELQRANELGVAKDAIYPKLAEARFKDGQNEALQSMSVADASSGTRAAVLAWQGLGQLAEGDELGASNLVHEALSIDPRLTIALIASARILLASRDYQQARSQLAQVLESDPESAEAWSALGDIELGQQNLEMAEKAFSEAIDNRAANRLDRLKRAVTRIDMGRLKEAQEDLDLLAKTMGRSPDVYMAQGAIFLANQRYEDAARALEIALEDEKRLPKALYLMAVTQYRWGHMQQGEQYARRFHGAQPGDVAGRKLLAKILLEKREFAEAEELIRPVVMGVPGDAGARNLLADALLGQGKTDQAMEMLAAAAASEQDSTDIQFRLALGSLQAGDREKGIEYLESTVETDPEFWQGEVLLILNLLREGQVDKATELAEGYRDRNPDSVGAYDLLGRVYMGANKLDRAEKAFLNALSIRPGDAIASYGLAAMALQKNDIEGARRYYEAVLVGDQKHLLTLMNLAALAARENDEDKMIQYLDRAAQSNPAAVGPRVALARHYLANGDPSKASIILMELDSEKRDIPMVLEVTAAVQIASKDYLHAKTTLEKLVSVQPEVARYHYLLARTYAVNNDRELARNELRRTIELEPNNVQARVDLAGLYVVDQDTVAVEEQLQVLRGLAPDNPDVLAIESALAVLRGDKQAALSAAQKSMEKTDSTSRMLASVRLRLELGDAVGAQKLQEEWVREHPDDLVARQALADLYAATGRVEDAIKHYSKVLEKEKDNFVVLNNLAWHLRHSDPKQALIYAERANEINPNSVTVLDTLAMVLSDNGEHKRAKRALERALEKSPGNPTLRFHSALLHEGAGDVNAAKRTLRQLLAENVNFPEKTEAEAMLARLKGN